MSDLQGFSKVFNKMFNPENNAATLLALNTAGMIFAALSNTFAAASDKNTSAEDKKFLVPAGLVTGVANIGVYFAMTKKLIDKLQGVEVKDETGKIIKSKEGLADVFLKKLGSEKVDLNAAEYAKKVIGKAEKGKLFGLGKKSGEYVQNMKQTLFEADGKTITQEARDLYKGSIKSGLGVLGAFTGAIIGCAIITPIVRDISAYFVQKKLERNNPSMQDKPYRPYFDPAHLKTGVTLNEYRYYKKQPINMKSYMNFTHGMKV